MHKRGKSQLFSIGENTSKYNIEVIYVDNSNCFLVFKELICQAVYKETNLDSIEIQGIESSVECYQVYEADLRRCELVRECCPQFES